MASGLGGLVSPTPAVTQAPVSLVVSSASSTTLPSITTVASSLAKTQQVASTPSVLPTTPLPPMSVLAGQSGLGHQLPLPQMLMNNTGHMFSVSPTTTSLNSAITTNGNGKGRTVIHVRGIDVVMQSKIDFKTLTRLVTIRGKWLGHL